MNIVFSKQKSGVSGLSSDLGPLVLLQNVVLRFLIYENFLRKVMAALGVSNLFCHLSPRFF